MIIGTNTSATTRQRQIRKARGEQARQTFRGESKEAAFKGTHLTILDWYEFYVAVRSCFVVTDYICAGLLAFAVCGGIVFEIVRMFF
jgi:hypothetical protein